MSRISQNASMFPSPPTCNVSSGTPIRKPEPLLSGCKQVDAFSDEGDYEEEEECFVTLDLSSVDQALVPSSSTYRLVGLDTVNPYLQLSGTIMRGHVQTLLGTEMLFKETEDALTLVSPTAVAAERKSFGPVRFQALINKRIAFRELDVKPKEVPTAENTDTLEYQDTWVSPLAGKGKNKSIRMSAEEASRRLLYPDSSSLIAIRPSFLSAEGVGSRDDGFGVEGEASMAVDDEPEASTTSHSGVGASTPTSGEPAALSTRKIVDDRSWLDPALTS